MLRRRMMLAQGGVSLPAGYTKIEYLESDGNSYIDTAFKPNQDTRVIMDVIAVATASTSTSAYLCGARSSSSSNQFALQTLSSHYSARYGSQEVVVYEGAVESRQIIDMNRNAFTVNGTSVTLTAETFTCPVSFHLFAMNNNGTAGYSPISSMRLYSCKIYDNGVLVRDFIPCTNPDGISGLWDSVNDVFYKMLPADYTKLDFIESDGTTYIDTGFKPNNNTRVVFEGYNNSTSSGWIFGAWKAVNNNMFCASALKTYNVCYGTKIWANATMPVGPISIDMNKNAYTYNGVSGTLSEQTFSCDYTMYLFHINAAGAVSSGSFNGRIYSVKIYDNGTLVRDFIPAMNASGEAGLYDLKNGVWYALKPVAKPKVENKISTWHTNHDVTPDGYILFHESGLQSEYPVASDITVTASVVAVFQGRPKVGSRNFTIPKGANNTGALLSGGYYEEISTSFLGYSPIESISPTEDDTYIYTF